MLRVTDDDRMAHRDYTRFGLMAANTAKRAAKPFKKKRGRRAAASTANTRKRGRGGTGGRRAGAGDETALMMAQKEMRKYIEGSVRERTRELHEKNTEIAGQAGQLRELSTRLLKVQDEERRRIARELHDSAGQELAALSMNFYVIRGAPGSLSLAQERAVNESCELLARLTEEIRTLSYLLHPPLLDETGLSSALQWYVDGFAERSKIAVRLHVAEDFGRLPTEVETTLFRIVQESLTNVHRHSGSTTAEIRLRRLQNEVRLEVLDTGVGMPVKKRLNGDDAKAGVGILGMSERVRQLGGSFVISAGAPGTRITASLPVRLQAE
jgi:two-component system NarL family sensor kinase